MFSDWPIGECLIIIPEYISPLRFTTVEMCGCSPEMPFHYVVTSRGPVGWVCRSSLGSWSLRRGLLPISLADIEKVSKHKLQMFNVLLLPVNSPTRLVYVKRPTRLLPVNSPTRLLYVKRPTRLLPINSPTRLLHVKMPTGLLHV